MNLTDQALKDLARKGAPVRIKELEKELHGLYAAFPDLFPRGKPYVTDYEMNRNGNNAKALIEGAAKLRKELKPKKRGRVHGLGQPVGGNYDDLIGVSEVAKELGIHASYIYSAIKRKKLRVIDYDGVRRGARVRRSAAQQVFEDHIRWRQELDAQDAARQQQEQQTDGTIASSEPVGVADAGFVGDQPIEQIAEPAQEQTV